MDTVQTILKALEAQRLPLHDEKLLQAEIHKVLCGAIGRSIVGREFKLDARNVIDFLVSPDIGIEVKIKGSKMEIFRQCQRYCKFPAIEKLILITNVSMGLPEMINGKDCYLFNLGKAWL